MSILDLLNKYRYEIKLNKTGLYNFVTGGNKELAGEGFRTLAPRRWRSS